MRICDAVNTSPPPFRFKRFAVHQSQAAMKVGFDGVLLGAWADVRDCRRILDVGTGTGLVALMLAQRTESTAIGGVNICAIEIDQAAWCEAKANIAASPWRDRVSVIHQSLQEFTRTPDSPYDLIVCNPPFFERDLLSPCHARSVARHARELTITELIAATGPLLDPPGRLCLVLPLDRLEDCLAMAGNEGLFCRRQLTVKPNPHKPAKRVLLDFQLARCPCKDDEITIEQERRHRYTSEFRELTRDFYLAF